MKRPWYAVFSAMLLLVPTYSPSAESFSLPSPALFLQQASEIEVPIDIDSGRWDSAPDWSITPGVLCTTDDKDFEEFRYPERIAYCRRNTSIRDKKTVSQWYGVEWEARHLYQYDHLLSLCLGGSNDLRNLWPMPYADARSKAKLEAALCRRLAKGEITQAQAVDEEIGWFYENAPQALPFLMGKGPEKHRPFGPS